MLALLPALLAALFAVWCGNLSGGATAAGAAASALSLLGVLVVAGAASPSDLCDPLRLGRAGRLLPPALWLAALGSLAASPVPRAGRVGIALLPAFLALPAAVARCWADESARRRGARLLAAVVGSAALFALAAAFASPVRPAFPALPLGHRNLLAAWLALLLPLSLLPAREPGRWRWLGAGAGLAGLAALLASRSLLGFLAAAAEAAVGLAWAGLTWAHWGRRLRPRTTRLAAALALLLALFLAVAAALQARRLGDVALGRDPSERTRAVYYAAGVRGALARPATGWGPGSTPWTLARFLVPIPGLNPPGEIVPDLHSLPLALAYELGAPGLLLAAALAGLFARRRLAELPAGADPGLAAAGLAGLLGGAVTALGSAAVGVAALPLAAALAAGAALAGTRPERVAETGTRPERVVETGPSERAGRLAPALYALAALAVLAPLVLAERAYEGAGAAGGSAERARALATATRLDPGFPLYRARLAWIADPAASLSRRAAVRGDRLAPLWLQAGVRGLFAGRAWAPDALRRACALDPLSPFAPFFLAAAAPGSAAAPALAARALLAEPRLAAATFWTGREALLARAVALVAASPGVDPGWRRSFVEAVAHLPADDGARAWLAFAVDEEPALSLSLNAFRRRPWPARWPLVEVRAAAARALRLPSATRLPGTSPAVFAAAGCSG